MTSIDNLFDWILEDIFTLLPRHDRLTCKEVCKRWYDILMERITFKEDRHIYIKTSKIVAGEDPMNVLMKTRKPYAIYTVNDDSDEKITDYVHLFGCIGTSIEEINYPNFGDCNDIFATMPNLKSLKMTDVSLGDTEKFFSKIRRIKANFTFHQLEKLQIGEIKLLLFGKTINRIENIKKFLPQNCSFIVSHVKVSNNDDFNDLCRLMEVAKIIKISFGDTKEMVKLIGENNIECEELSLTFKPEQNPYSTLQALQNKYRGLKKIHLSCSFLPPVEIEWPKITSLTLSLHFSSLQSLEHLPNLEHLSLKPLMDECGFDHESLSLPKLKKFELTVESLCNECKRALVNSFENLEDFSISGLERLFWNEFRKLIDNWKKLKTLSVETGGYENIKYEDESLVFEPKVDIRSITFLNFSDLEEKDIIQISKSFPNVEELKLIVEYYWEYPCFSDIVAVVAPNFTKLQDFIFRIMVSDGWDETNHQQTDSFWTIHDSLGRNGFPIRDKEAAKYAFFTDDLIHIKFNRQKKTAQMVKKL